MAGFTIGQNYTREEVATIIGMPIARRMGPWLTGYDSWQDAIYIFANVGVAGRTGHDYPNRWSGKSLIWYGKTAARRGQPFVDRMISNTLPVHIFWRGADRAPFTYAGDATAASASDTAPVEIVWEFEAQKIGVANPVAPQNGTKWKRGPAPSIGTMTVHKLDGPTHLYVMVLHGAADAVVQLPPGHRLVKIGMSNDIARRSEEMNVGFPPGAALEWRVTDQLALTNAKAAWLEEGKLLERMRVEGRWVGGEFAIVPAAMVANLLS